MINSVQSPANTIIVQYRGNQMIPSHSQWWKYLFSPLCALELCLVCLVPSSGCITDDIIPDWTTLLCHKDTAQGTLSFRLWAFLAFCCIFLRAKEKRKAKSKKWLPRAGISNWVSISRLNTSGALCIIPTLYSSESWKLVNVVFAVIKYKY